METIDRSLLTFLLNALWQAPLAAGVAAAACRLMRNGPARHRHAVCVAALAMALLLPLASARRWSGGQNTFAVPGPSLAAPAQALAPLGPKTGITNAESAAGQGIPLPRTAAWLAIAAYALLLAFRAVRLAQQAVRTRRILRDAEPSSSTAISRVWNRCTAAMGVEADLRCSAEIDGPVTAGRTILLPAGMLAGTPEAILTTAIGHEMAHVARRDFACSLLYEALALPLWFHPATGWLRRQIDRTRELACDELVTKRLVEPAAYAESLVSIAAGISGLGQPRYTLGVLDGDILEERVRRLLHRPSASLKRARMMLTAGLAALALCMVGASSLAISARAQSVAQPEMRLAGQAYNSGDYAAAVSHFEKAVGLEPANTNARLFLANAYVQQSMSSGERSLLQKAKQQYRETLDRDPQNVTAIFGFASLMDFDQAGQTREWMMKVIGIDPKNKNAYYTAAVADWQMAFRAVRDANHGVGPDLYNQISDSGLRAKLRGQVLPVIEDGFRMLRIALDMDPQWRDAMAYMNLLFRLKAPLADSPAERDNAIAQADEWVHKALAQKRSAGGRPVQQIDVDQPAPAAIPAMVPEPPPPPPPPPGGFQGNGDKVK